MSKRGRIQSLIKIHESETQEKARCDQCLMLFSISDGFPAHNRECASLHAEACQEYYKASFSPSELFSCSLCDLPRRSDLEWWYQFEEHVIARCMSCDVETQKDLNIHIHTKPELDMLLCGTCGDVIKPDTVTSHFIKHLKMNSFLIKICSKTCLDETLEKIDTRTLKNFPNKLTCSLCVKSFESAIGFEGHLFTHKIDVGFVRCPACPQKYKRERLEKHMERCHSSECSDSGVGRPAEKFTCAHCFQRYETLEKLSSHISTIHAEMKSCDAICDTTEVERDLKRFEGGHESACQSELSCHVNMEVESFSRPSSSLSQSEALTSVVRVVKKEHSRSSEIGLSEILGPHTASVKVDIEYAFQTTILNSFVSGEITFGDSLPGLRPNGDTGSTAEAPVEIGTQCRLDNKHDHPVPSSPAQGETVTTKRGTKRKRYPTSCTECNPIVFFPDHRAFIHHRALYHETVGGVREYANYLKETFIPGRLFVCNHCDTPREEHIEFIKPVKDLIICVNCSNEFPSDITCHIHRTTMGDLVCGYCSSLVDEADIRKHVEVHLKLRSYLVDICSVRCLKALIGFWPENYTSFDSRYKCIVCFASKSSMQNMRTHFVTHTREKNESILPEQTKLRRKSATVKFKPRKVVEYKQYLRETFSPDQLFDCKCCHLPRLESREVFRPDTFETPCANCRRQFKNNVACHIHRENERIICGYCSVVIPPDEVSDHCLAHQKERSYLADICSLMCLEALLKTWPKNLHHDFKDRFKCLICLKAFKHVDTLNDHIQVHRPDAYRFPCPICNKILPTRKRLKSHHNSNHKLFSSCPLCKFSAPALNSLKTHFEKVHPSVLEVPCLQCSVVLTDTGAYFEHMLGHKEERHECTVCLESFPSPAALKTHEKIHSATKVCTKCHRDFPDAASLEAHGKECALICVCHHCNFSCKRLFKLRHHISIRHFVLQCYLDRPYRCKDCNETFTNARCLAAHRATHKSSRICDLCGFFASNSNSLAFHKHYHHKGTRRFVCEKCSQSFKLKHHLAQHMFYNHTDDFPFKCDMCSQRFRRESNLVDHKKKACKALKK